MPFLEQEAAAALGEAHSLLFSWTSALWGGPILLVDDVEANTVHMPQNHQEQVEQEVDEDAGETNEGGAAPGMPESDQPTQAFWALSPPREPRGGVQILARQSSHRRRRIHAIFHGTPDDEDLDAED
eukprot:s3505_g9.t1